MLLDGNPTGFELEFTTENTSDKPQRALPTIAVVLVGSSMGGWIASGQVRSRETVHEGIEAMPDGVPPVAAGLFGYLGYDMIRLVESGPAGGVALGARVARELADQPQPPAVIFVTAHDNHQIHHLTQ